MALYALSLAVTTGSIELLGPDADKPRRAPLSFSITAGSTELLGSEASEWKSRSICHTQQEEVGAQL